MGDAPRSDRRGLRSPEAVRRFVERHGVVLVAARGPVPRLTEAIVGEPIRGSWWGHPEGRRIYALLSRVMDDDDVLCCRAVEGKVTLVHRRLWPALVRASARFEPGALAEVASVHTDHGHHERLETPFPGWVPDGVERAAEALSEEEALDALGAWARAPGVGSPTRSRARATRKGSPQSSAYSE